MRILALGLLLLLPTVIHAADESQSEARIPPEKEVILFESSKLGTVTFLHKMHAGLQGVECSTCHHRGVENSAPEDCHNCHKPKPTDEKAPKAIKAFHTRCRGCHQYTVESGQKAGPVKKCTLCHVKEGRPQSNR